VSSPRDRQILKRAVGADRVLYSVDYPFEDMAEAASWFDQAAISEPDRLKIARSNAQALFLETGTPQK